MRGVIAIDGPAASGKGTLARRLATHYGLPHLDTGLLYRATACALLDRNLSLDDPHMAGATARALDLAHLDDPRLRSRDMGEAASRVAVIPEVREALIQFQRDFANQPAGAVLDGRDIGTVICPNASVKLFITATAEERARRRFNELIEKDPSAVFETVLSAIRQRDARDAGRSSAPLVAADDAHVLDTTQMNAEEAFAKARTIIETHMNMFEPAKMTS